MYKPETQISKSPVSRKLQFTCSKVYGTTLGVAVVTSASELLMTILDSTLHCWANVPVAATQIGYIHFQVMFLASQTCSKGF